MSTSRVCTMVIELRSDMCCGTGEANGVSVDQVTALDSYGLPIIPAKRLKGLLREEAALIGDADMVSDLFGRSGQSQAGKLAFDAAHVAGHDQLVAKIRGTKGGITPGLVADVYTTSRTGTRVNEEGTAADHTLRTIQFVRKCDTQGIPTHFVCRIRGVDLTDAEKDLVTNAIRCLRAIGLGKSRGMGEVSCHGWWDDERAKQPTGAASTATSSRVGYRLTLDAPAAIQSGAGESLDYLPGSVMQGVFAGLLCASDPDFFQQHVLRGTRFLNAYVDVDPTTASAPVPLSYCTDKNAEAVEIKGSSEPHYPLRDQVIDKQPEGVQSVGVGGYGVVGNSAYRVGNVEQSLSFHSSSKNSPQGKQYYSVRSINAGQSFSGLIVAEPEAIKRLREVGSRHEGDLRIGTAKGSGFGGCHLEFFDAPEPATLDVRGGDRVVIRLLSDVVFIDKSGANSTDAAAFVEHLSSSNALGFQFNTNMGASDDACKVFAKTCLVGGYNAYWKLPKRQYVAFKKGSVIAATVTACDAGSVSSEAWTGILQTEGFGRLSIGKVGERASTNWYVRCDAMRVPDSSSGKGDEGVGELVELNKQAVASFGHDFALNEVLGKALLRACELGDDFRLGSASKSSFMRISSILASAVKSPDDELYSEAFRGLARDNFKKDEAVLFGACDGLANAFDDLVAGNEQLSTFGKNLVFRRFVLEYLHQVKVRYTMAKGAAHD